MHDETCERRNILGTDKGSIWSWQALKDIPWLEIWAKMESQSSNDSLQAKILAGSSACCFDVRGLTTDNRGYQKITFPLTEKLASREIKCHIHASQKQRPI